MLSLCVPSEREGCGSRCLSLAGSQHCSSPVPVFRDEAEAALHGFRRDSG